MFRGYFAAATKVLRLIPPGRNRVKDSKAITRLNDTRRLLLSSRGYRWRISLLVLSPVEAFPHGNAKLPSSNIRFPSDTSGVNIVIKYLHRV